MRDVAVSPAPAARKWSDRRARFDFGRNARFFNSRASSPPSIARRPIPAFPPVSREPDCFPESAPGSARHAYRGLNTHLDLGRLEGRDGAGESGGNAGHFCSCFFVLKEGEVCRNGARDAPNAPFIGAQLIHGRVGRRTTVSANRRREKIQLSKSIGARDFIQRESHRCRDMALWLSSLKNKRRMPDFPNRSLTSIHRPLRLALRVPVLWKYDPGWEIEKRFGMGIWSSMGDFTRQPGTRNCPLHLPMPRSSQKIFIPAV
jgi:hypothetical protein